MTAYKWLLIIDPTAQERFNHLPAAQKRAIFRYLRELLNADDPYSLPFVEMLKDRKFERNRKFRAGNYRVFFAVERVEVAYAENSYKGSLYLLDIRDRKEAY